MFLFNLQDNVDAKSYGLHDDRELAVLNKSSKYDQERCFKNITAVVKTHR